MASASTSTFNPNEHLIPVGKDKRGKEILYLEVKWRQTWFRLENPDGVIETEIVKLDDNEAVVRASVRRSDGGVATGYARETPATSQNACGAYLEKA